MLVVLHLNPEYWTKGTVQVHSIFRNFMLYSRYIHVQQAICSKQVPHLEFPCYSSYPIHFDQFTSTRNLKFTEAENAQVHVFITSSQIYPFLPPNELAVVGIVATAAATAEDWEAPVLAAWGGSATAWLSPGIP